MPATVIPVKGMQQGFVGNISSEGLSLRSPRIVNLTDTHNVAFGEPVLVNSNNSYSSVAQFIAGGGTFTAALALGIAASNVHTNIVYPVQGGSNATSGFYIPGQVCDALVIGTMNVQINNGTPTGANGIVYVRIAANVAIPAGVIGGFEAVADGANTIALTNVKFKNGTVESDGTAQVTILTRTIA
jgi:hypothetical protein